MTKTQTPSGADPWTDKQRTALEASIRSWEENLETTRGNAWEVLDIPVGECPCGE